METADGDHWRARTIGIDGASSEALRAYTQELDGRIPEMTAQLQKDRLHNFRGLYRRQVD